MQLTFAASEIVVTKIIIPILTYGTVPLFHVTFTGTLTKEILKKKKTIHYDEVSVLSYYFVLFGKFYTN